MLKGNGLWPLIQTGRMAYEYYASSLFFAGRLKEAIPMFQKAIRLNPIGSSSAFLNLGVAYGLTGRFEEAVSAYKQALLRSPDNIFAHIGLACYLHCDGPREGGPG